MTAYTPADRTPADRLLDTTAPDAFERCDRESRSLEQSR